MEKTVKFGRYKELDALRGIAALMVVLFHFTVDIPEAPFRFNVGVTGVDLFFILSGFVIFMSLSHIKSSKDFIINRISRLYPTYWACVTFTFLLIIIKVAYDYGGLNGHIVMKYFVNMTMFQHYFKVDNLDGPYWTLIIEMVFYISILLLFHFKKIRYLNIIGFILSIGIVLLTNFYYHPIVDELAFWFPLIKFLPLFFAGTLFYRIYTERNRIIERYSLLLVCLVSQIMLYDFYGNSNGFISQLEYAITLFTYFGFFILFIYGRLKFIVSKLTLFLGKISYALYLIHKYVSVKLIIPFLINELHMNFWIASLLIALPIVIFLSALITYYIEIPLNKKMRYTLQKYSNRKSIAI